MQIWFFIKWLGFRLCNLSYLFCQKFIGWFILGRECNRCKHKKYNAGWGFNECSLDNLLEDECLTSITKKHFEREKVQNGQIN